MSLKPKEVEEITIRYYQDIYKFCCARCGDSELAFDVAQETFLTLVKKKNELSGDNIRAWLFRTASNKCHEEFRRMNRENNNISIDEIEDSCVVTDEMPCFNEIQTKLMSILTEDEKELFTLLYVERESASAVAEKLGIRKDNLYQKNSRLKKKLRKNFKYTDFFILVLAFRISGI